MEGPVKIGPYELVSQDAANSQSAWWRLTASHHSMVEGSIRRALEMGDERMLRASGNLVEMLPRVDGIQGPFSRMLDGAAKEWTTRHGTPWPLARTSPMEVKRSPNWAGGPLSLDEGVGVFMG
jgi:hypothetical protein